MHTTTTCGVRQNMVTYCGEQGSHPANPQSMNDLLEASRLFETSNFFQSASSGLRRLLREGPNKYELEAIKWVAEFLVGVDWSKSPGVEPKLGGSLALDAAAIRPVFYGALLNVEQQLKSEGITTTE